MKSIANTPELAAMARRKSTVYDFSSQYLDSLVGAATHVGDFYCDSKIPLASLALSSIHGEIETDNDELDTVLNSFFPNAHVENKRKHLLELQQALIEAGFEKEAEL